MHVRKHARQDSKDSDVQKHEKKGIFNVKVQPKTNSLRTKIIVSNFDKHDYEGGSESSVIGVITRHDRLLYYTLIKRATFLLYNDAKIIQERKKYFEIDALKDTCGKTTGTFLEIVNIIMCVSCVICL